MESLVAINIAVSLEGAIISTFQGNCYVNCSTVRGNDQGNRYGNCYEGFESLVAITIAVSLEGAINSSV